MKKIAKISLVAAIAVAGLTTANAQPLEEAIKNVDISGSVVYRYNNINDSAIAGSDQATSNNNYKIATTLAAKVNDDVKFNSRFIVGVKGDKTGLGELDTDTNTDQTVGVNLSNAYFGYTGLKNTTVNVGKQGLTTPWTVAVDSDNNEQTGTGILALSTVGPVTLAGAYFNQTNLNASTDSNLNTNSTTNKANSIVGVLGGDTDILTVGAIAAIGPVTADAWFLNMENTFNTYTVGAKSATKVAGIDLTADARFASLTFNKDAAVTLQNVINPNTVEIEKDNSIIKLVLTADAGLIDGKIAYAKTGKDGGLTALDNDASTTLLGWNLTSNGKADADYWQAVVGVDILSNLNLSANYGNIQYIASANSTTEYTDEEIYAQLLYKMSKNLSTYVRYGTYTSENTTQDKQVKDQSLGRLQVEYTF